MEFENTMEAMSDRRVALIGQLFKEAEKRHWEVYGYCPEKVYLDPELVSLAIAQIETDS